MYFSISIQFLIHLCPTIRAVMDKHFNKIETATAFGAFDCSNRSINPLSMSHRFSISRGLAFDFFYEITSVAFVYALAFLP